MGSAAARQSLNQTEPISRPSRRITAMERQPSQGSGVAPSSVYSIEGGAPEAIKAFTPAA
jgi:hypothetical protein